jgi:8-oxo-dGTP diphosphatase
MHQRYSKDAAGRNMWAFPGGHLEMWEDPHEAVIREIQEEVGYDIHIKRPVFWCFENVMFKDDHKHYFTLFYKCSSPYGIPHNMEPEKGSDWMWFDWYHLPSPVMPGIQMIVDKGENPWAVVSK